MGGTSKEGGEEQEEGLWWVTNKKSQWIPHIEGSYMPSFPRPCSDLILTASAGGAKDNLVLIDKEMET